MADNLDRIPGLLGDALVLVTGAGQGNGRAIALGVAAAGAKVIVTDVRQDTAQSTAGEIQARGGKEFAYQLDVTDAAACTALAKSTRPLISTCFIAPCAAAPPWKNAGNTAGDSFVADFASAVDAVLA